MYQFKEGSSSNFGDPASTREFNRHGLIVLPTRKGKERFEKTQKERSLSVPDEFKEDLPKGFSITMMAAISLAIAALVGSAGYLESQQTKNNQPTISGIRNPYFTPEAKATIVNWPTTK